MKVVEILSGLDGGGVENMLLNYCRCIDLNKIHIDFIVHNQTKGAIEDKFLDLGCNVFHVTPKSESFIKNTIEIFTIIHREHYDVVHSHMNYKGVTHMIIAKICGVKRRIIHQHIAYYPVSGIMKILAPLLKDMCKMFSNCWVACSKDAAIDMFGVRAFNKGKTIVLNNAIDVKEFSYNPIIRNKIRAELGIEESFVVGMVGRFHPQKNHDFMLEIFKEIIKIEPNAILLLVGGGEQIELYKKKVEEQKLSNNVIFTGIIDNINEFYQAMDVFVLPTLYEGFGIVLIESQCAGLETFTSLEGVPQEVKVTELLHFISLRNTAKEWANYIFRCRNFKNRISRSEDLKAAGYDVISQNKMLEQLYTGKY